MIKSISFDLDDTLWPLMPNIMKAEEVTNEWIKENYPGTATLLGTKDVIEIRDELIPIGKANILIEGTDVSIISYGIGIKHSLTAVELAKDINISVELIDLRCLRPIDYNTVFESIKKTNRCITVEECFPVCSIGNHLSASIMENVFDYLDSPVINCTGKDVPMPYAKNLELAALITPDEIFEKIKKVTNLD